LAREPDIDLHAFFGQRTPSEKNMLPSSSPVCYFVHDSNKRTWHWSEARNRVIDMSDIFAIPRCCAAKSLSQRV